MDKVDEHANAPAGSGGATPSGDLLDGALARGGVALEKAVLYITWLIPVLEGFPKSQRFLLGDRLQALALEVVEGLIEATYSKAPKAPLVKVNLALEKQRVLSRVAYNLRHLDVRRYELLARKVDEIGQRVGAWIKKS